MSYLIKNKSGLPLKHNGQEVFGTDRAGVIKSIDESKRIITIVGTDESKDRQGDIIMVNGWEFENFLGNPVFLWAHDYGSIPIARATKVMKKRSPRRVVFEETFPPEGLFPLADLIFQLYKIKQINACSVGFIPKDWENIDDADKDSWWTPKRYLKQELLELSGCAVPANPAALQEALKGMKFNSGNELEKFVKDLVGGHIEPPKNKDDILGVLELKPLIVEEGEESEKVRVPGMKITETERLALERDEEVSLDTAATVSTSEVPSDEEGKGIGASRSLPLADKETSWDGVSVKTSVAKWASSDGSGEIEKMDWAKFRKAFSWYNPDDQENMDSYKAPIALVIDGSLKAVFKGVVAAMESLNGVATSVGIPDADRVKVYNFLAHYYRRFDEEPPELKSFSDLLKELEETKETVLKLSFMTRNLNGTVSALTQRASLAVKATKESTDSTAVAFIIRRRRATSMMMKQKSRS